MSDNPIQRLLDERRLPWRESQSALIARHGTFDDNWFQRRPLVLLDLDPPPLPGLLRPLQFETNPLDDPSMPPLRFSGWLWASEGRWFRDRAMLSLDLALRSLEPELGPPEAYDTSNTRGWRWRFGPAAIELICFPHRLNLSVRGNEIARIEPRFYESCWVDIATGYRPAATPQERAWIAAFVPAFTFVEGRDAARLVAYPPRQAVLEYVREPANGFERTVGRLGRTADGEAVIFGSDQFYIVPTCQIDHVHVERVTPGRGSGYSEMRLVCRGAFGDRPLREVMLTGHGDWDGCDRLAAEVAAWLQRPCILGDPQPDC